MIINVADIDISRVKDKVVQQILICMFTDAYIPADELPEGIVENRGCWMDRTKFTINNQKSQIYLGSRLWTLHQLPFTDETPETARRYVEDCLQPLVLAGILAELEISAEKDKDRLNFLLKYNGKSLEVRGY